MASIFSLNNLFSPIPLRSVMLNAFNCTHHDPSAFRWKADFCTWYNHLEMIPMVKSGRVSYRNVIRCVLFWSDPSLCSLLWYHCDSALISSMSVFLTEVFVFVQIKPLGLKPSSLREADEFRKQRLMMEISGFPPDESEPQMCPSVSENVFFFNTFLSSIVFYKVCIMPRSSWEEMCRHLQGYFFWFLKERSSF